MAVKFQIQILDGQTEAIEYFDRLKTSHGAHRIITSPSAGKQYNSRQDAERDAILVEKYYSGEHIIEIVELDNTIPKNVSG